MVSAGDYRWLLLSACVCVVVAYVYPLSLPTPLFDPDEGLHAVIAQGMVESGDYLTPRLEGEFFRDKPILYFCAQALSLKVLGMTEAAVRLPGFLFALTGAGTTWLLARRWFGPVAGIIAFLSALTMVIPMAIAQAGIHDLALVSWTSLLLLSLREADSSTTVKRRCGLFCCAAAATALAILTKGLIGIAIVGVGYAASTLVSRNFVFSRSIRFLAVLSAGAVLASPWFLLMEAGDPGYLKYYFFDRHFLGYVTTSQNHGDEPWYYYLPVIVGGALPWGLYSLAAFARHNSNPNPAGPTTLSACWLVGGALFLSLAGSKLVTYALPLFPAVAILAGAGWNRFLTADLEPSTRLRFVRTAYALTVTGAVAPFLLLLVVRVTYLDCIPPGVWPAAMALSGIPCIALPMMRRRRFAPAAGVGAVWMALMLAWLITWPGQLVAEQNSARSLGHWLRDCDELPSEVLVFGGRTHSALFYLTPAQRCRLRAGQVRRVRPGESIKWHELRSDVVIAVPTDEIDPTSLPALITRNAKTEVAGRFLIIRPAGGARLTSIRHMRKR